ncbi:MAG TPA: hypothetical protein VF170_13440 [Planctomycetaceae bacterium]
MGWTFREGITRKELIEQRTRGWETTRDDDLTVATTCLAHCYRGGAFSGVLWAVWERTFTRFGVEAEPPRRWITCDLLRHERDGGWGYKDLAEGMGPFSVSCPLAYLDLVPLDHFGGNAGWRERVRAYHAHARRRRLARAGR